MNAPVPYPQSGVPGEPAGALSPLFHRILAVPVLLALLAASWPLSLAGEEERPKKIYAHHMGSMNVGRGALVWHAENASLGDPRFSNGGDYRTYPLAPREVNRLSYEESADLQIRRAMAIGVDGFAVNAWAGGDDAKRFLDALFTVAEEKDYPFEITICPDVNTMLKPDGYTAAVVESIRELLDKYGDSAKLARRDGKPLIAGYQSVFIWVDYLWGLHEEQADVDRMRTTPEGWATISDAFRNVEELVGEELFFQFELSAFFHGVHQPIPDRLHAEAAAAVARQFPAVSQFLPDRHTMNIARAVLAEGAEWGHPVYLQYDNNRTNTTHGGPGTRALRQRWQEARELGSSLIHYTTWNDYHEHSNLSPGTNTRYAFYDLSGFFIEWWKTGEMPQPTRERVYLFSRKYPQESSVFPFRAPSYLPGAIEVLTILHEPALIDVPGRAEPYLAPAGLHVRQFPVTPGAVSVHLWREAEEVLVLNLPEPVTDKPFRQDNGIVAISSECERYWRNEFGEAQGLLNAEYADVDGDGLPNWFEMYWFGRINNYDTATVTESWTVANSEGMTNLDAYLAQKSPFDPSWDPSVREGPFRGVPAPIPGIIQAEDFDLGGQGRSYHDTVLRNQGGAYRPQEYVDIEPARDIVGSYNVAWIAEGEWIEYTVEVEESGYYDVTARVASPVTGGLMRIRMDGVDITGAMTVPVTGAWQQWQTITAGGIHLEEGVRRMRVIMDSGGFNLNYVEFIPTVLPSPTAYDAWVAAIFPEELWADISIVGKMADPDGDGVPNIVEYALGGNPLWPDRDRLPAMRVIEGDGETYLALEYIRPAGATGVGYVGEVSHDLATWSSGPGHVEVEAIVPSGEMEIVVVRDAIPLDQAGNRFLRLRVVDEQTP